MGLGSVRFMVGLDDFNGLFQPKGFYDAMITSDPASAILKWLETSGVFQPISTEKCRTARAGLRVEAR